MTLKDPSEMKQIVLQAGGSVDLIKLSDDTTIVDKDGNIDAPVTTTNLTTSGNTTLGDASADTLTVPSTSQFNAPVTVGVDDTGYDVKLFGATSGSYMLWDESADQLLLNAATLSAQGKVSLYKIGSAAESASGLLMGVGTTANPATSASAGAIMAEFRTQSTATSGDSRGLYWRHDINGAGGGGESLRSFSKVTAAASTVRGAHISLDLDAAGSVSGFGAGVDAQLMLGGATYSDTLTPLNLEVYCNASADIGVATSSMFRLVIQGDATAVGNVDDNLSFMNLNGFTAASGKMIDTDITALTGKAGLPVYLDGALYGYIPIITGS